MMSKPIRVLLPVVLLLAGITMMIMGIWRGELDLIFQKAAVICLECIGIG